MMPVGARRKSSTGTQLRRQWCGFLLLICGTFVLLFVVVHQYSPAPPVLVRCPPPQIHFLFRVLLFGFASFFAVVAAGMTKRLCGWGRFPRKRHSTA
jgi:hypothetical protein